MAFSLIGDPAAEIVVNDPDYKEVRIPVWRQNEVLLYLDYTKGDETFIQIEPVELNQELGNVKEYGVGLAKTPNPIEFNPMILKVAENAIMRIAVPIMKLKGFLKFKITFKDLGAGIPGDLEFGLMINKL